ncbi:hypothetical protein COMNV_01687 [Commensalibacter sp. Nvir]|uniref:hypothetical protein n=1 Tax=Commensalibacter sp. Nvir TaxID=3069817 RepID=UPI002D53B964|nr:hypothetical protein COMNV_01687 [Commensalibacter sp. Nvir]
MTNYKKKLTYFTICSSLAIDQNSKGAVATISPENWLFSHNHLTEMVMLEGMNQFASRLVEELYPPDNLSFYLPGMIEHFQTTLNKTSAKMIIFGNCELINNNFRVTSSVTTESGEIIATSINIVTKSLYSGIQKVLRGADNPNVPVWEIDCGSQNASIVHPVQVRFYKDHPVFDEHFLNLPVVPGAIQTEIVLKRLLSFFPNTHTVVFEKVKFIHAMRPDMSYLLCLLSLPKTSTMSFSFSFMRDETRVTTGKIRLDQAGST